MNCGNNYQTYYHILCAVVFILWLAGMVALLWSAMKENNSR